MRSAKLACLWLAKVAGAFLLARWLTAHRLKILCYHGFETRDEAGFRPKLFISRHAFERRLVAIRKYGFKVLPLADAIERLYDGTLPKHSLVITADDGFHSFHRIAVPLLTMYGFPATVYVTTYYVRHGNPVFRLVIQYMFWRTQRRLVVLPDVRWTKERNLDFGDRHEVESVMFECIDFGERQCSENERLLIAAEVGRLLDVPYESLAESRMLSLMSPAELQSLLASGISVELHTHRHTFPSGDRAAAEKEILDNRCALGTWLPNEAKHFCYPSGLWTREQWQWLDDLGIRSATTCDPGLNSEATPRHSLRRFLDGSNIHQLEFESALCGFSDIARSVRRWRPVSRDIAVRTDAPL